MRRLAEDQEGQGGWRSRPKPSSLEHSPEYRGTFYQTMIAPSLKAELRSCLVLLWGLGGRIQDFHFGIVGLETTRSGLRNEFRLQEKVDEPIRAGGWLSRPLDSHHVQVDRRGPSGGEEKTGKWMGGAREAKDIVQMNDPTPVARETLPGHFQ